MPVWKYRSVEEMDGAIWHPVGTPSLFRAIRAVWELADRASPRRFPPGVYKLRNMEEAQALRDAWEHANVEEHRQRQRR